nr:MAG TPA: prohead serine protease [Caudoviricetes sp.]
MVKTVSVGFIPKQRQEDNRRIITSAELLELSFVAVPCNPNALSLDQKQLMKKGIEAGILQEEKSELEAFKAEILEEIHEVKALLQAVVDGNTKQKDEANIIAKETLQSIVRAGNEGLAMFKKAVR